MDTSRRYLAEVKRLVEGPCLFCQRSSVAFSEEHLPPESLVGEHSVVLINWVCSDCNTKRFGPEDQYFCNNYHGAAGRVIRTVVGKKGRGAEVARKDLWAKYQLGINTIQLHFKRRPKDGELDAANPDLAPTGVGRLEVEQREVNPRRLGRCLAKMALETVAYLNPEAAQRPELDALRQYALGQGKLKFLSYALGTSKDRLGVQLCGVKFNDEASSVMVSLLYLPLVVYAVQVSNHEDLRPLWLVAQRYKMIFDKDGSRTKKIAIGIDLHRPSPEDA